VNGPLRVVIAGGGSNAPVAATYLGDALRAAGVSFEVVGVLDDGRPDCARLATFGLRYLGPVSDAGRCGATSFVLGVGKVDVRRRLVAAIGTVLGPLTVVHPNARVGRGVVLGPGAMVQPFAVLAEGVTLGPHVHVSVGTTVGPGSVTGSFVSLFARCAIGRRVRLGDGVLIGTRAVVADGVTVGAGASVGAGAVVLADVAPGVTVAGNPARVISPAAPS